MSSQGNGQRIPYQVVLPEQVKDDILRAHQQAVLAGKGQKFLDTLRAIHERLTQDPLDFGEPLYRLPALQLLVRQGAVSGMVVDYAVHEKRPLVFVQGVKVLS